MGPLPRSFAADAHHASWSGVSGPTAYKDVARTFVHHTRAPLDLVIPTAASVLEKHGGYPTYWPCGVRCIGGVTLIRALLRNLGTWQVMLREKAQAEKTARPKVPMRQPGADCFVLARKRGNARGAKGAGHRRWD